MTEEGDRGDWQTENLNLDLILSFVERQNWDLKSHFHLTFWLQRNKQPVQVIESESSSKISKTHPEATQTWLFILVCYLTGR